MVGEATREVTRNDIRYNRVENELNRVKDELEPRKLEQEHDKPMVEIDLYSVIKQKYIEREVLDKIRERIELEKLGYPPSADYYKAIMKVLRIIDKYKSESEGEGMDKYSICTECGSKMTYRTNLEYTHDGVTVKPVKGFRCEKCGEIVFEHNEAKRIEILVQKVRDKK